MSVANVERYLPLLKILQVVPNKVVKSILVNADDEFVQTICEICLNLCKGNVKCDKKSYKKLIKYKSCIHKLSKVNKSQKNLKKERKVLAQKGGAFLPILLPSVISALAQFL